MKQLPLIYLLCATLPLFSQVSANANYQAPVTLAENNLSTQFPANADLIVSVKCLANVKADNYVAVFSITQTGKTAEETNALFDGRANQIRAAIAAKPGVETYIDMISFVPTYEWDVEKKVFNKKTYVEVPTGFELKKNLHIRYTDPELLHEFIGICAQAEVYDLVKVDYISSSLETVKKDLASRARTLLQEKLKNYTAAMGTAFDTADKQLADGFKVIYPIEAYKSYQAANSAPLNAKRYSKSNQADYATTQYYQPVVDKEFDFVVNPVVVEPVIQVMYEVKIRLQKEQKTNKEYFMISPSGEIKTLNFDKK